MKAFCLVQALIFLGFAAFAQSSTITIHCEVYTHGPSQDVRVDYLGVDKFLPDSLRTAVIVDYTKGYVVRAGNENNLILLMEADGWKISSVISADRFNPVCYLMGKDVAVDEPTRRQYIANIEKSFKRST